MNVNEIRIKHAGMLLEFMDGGEKYHGRTTWAVGSMRDREPFTAAEKEKIEKWVCPRCGGRLREEIDISNGELGRFIQCVSCARDWTEPEPETLERFRKLPTNLRPPKKHFRKFKCAYCGKRVQGYFTMRQKFCDSDCYRSHQRVYFRNAYRMKNNLTRYLGRE